MTPVTQPPLKATAKEADNGQCRQNAEHAAGGNKQLQGNQPQTQQQQQDRPQQCVGHKCLLSRHQKGSDVQNSKLAVLSVQPAMDALNPPILNSVRLSPEVSPSPTNDSTRFPPPGPAPRFPGPPPPPRPCRTATTSPSLITSTRASPNASLAGRRQLRDGDAPLADQVVEMHHRLLVADLLALLLVRRVQRYAVEHRRRRSPGGARRSARPAPRRRPRPP